MAYIDETYGKQLEEALRGLVSRPALGQPWFGFHESEVPAGVLLFTAATHSRVLYADFWNYIQNKNLVKTEEEWQSIYSEQGWCPFYSDGDGIDTFRMPSAPLYLHGADTLGEAGKYVQEGLPNISGEVFNFIGDNASWGPYTNSTYGNAFIAGKDANVGGTLFYTTQSASASGANSDGFILDASRCSPVYGNSSHITPETSKILFGVWAISAPQQPIPDATVEGIISELGVASNNALEANTKAEEAKNGLNGVVRSINGVAADAAGNVNDVAASGSNYIRFTNGLQIYFANVTIPANSLHAEFTFPAAFKSAPIITGSFQDHTSPGMTSFGSVDTSHFTVGHHGATGAYGWPRNINVVAIGKWK